MLNPHHSSAAIRHLLFVTLLGGSLQAMSLSEAVSYALKHSTVVQQSRYDVEQARLSRKQAKVQQFGELNLLADYNRYDSPRTLAPLTPSVMQSGTPIAEARGIFSLGMLYSVPLFTGFAQMRQLQIATLAQEMSKAKVHLSKEELAYNVRSLYLTILAQGELIRAQQAYIRGLNSLERQVSQWIEAGKKAPVDRLKVQADLQNAQAVLASLESGREITRATLKALIGTDPGRLQALKIHPRPPRSDLSSLKKQIPRLRKMRLEDLAVKKSDVAIKKSQSAKLPQISLTAYAGENFGEDTAHDLGLEHEKIWQVGLHANWNLVDFGKRSLETQKARIAKMKAQLKREQTRRDLEKLLHQGIARIRESYAKYKAELSGLELSRKSEAIERARYESGVATLNDLLLAKGRSQLARAKTIESRYNYQKSIYYLDYLLERGVRK